MYCVGHSACANPPSYNVTPHQQLDLNMSAELASILMAAVGLLDVFSDLVSTWSARGLQGVGAT